MDKYLKQEIKNSFYDTINRVEKDLFLMEQNKIALNNTFVYKEEETIGLDSLKIYDGKVSVIDSSTTGAVEFENTAVLNFASATMIGGNPQSGSITQEAMLNRCTTLYPTLNSSQVKTEYYNYFKRINDDIYTDRMVISRNIYIIKDDQIVPNPFIRQEYLKIDVITSPAPNLSRKKMEKDEYIRIYTSRIKKIFRLAALYKNTTIIVGAFGCGMFNNPPELAAECFKRVLFKEKYKDYFKNVVFAIPKDENNNFKIFKEIICE